MSNIEISEIDIHMFFGVDEEEIKREIVWEKVQNSKVKYWSKSFIIIIIKSHKKYLDDYFHCSLLPSQKIFRFNPIRCIS